MEHVFPVVKGLWGFTKVRYRRLAKNATRSFVALGLANIYLARKRSCDMSAPGVGALALEGENGPPRTIARHAINARGSLKSVACSAFP